MKYRTIVADPPWELERGPEWASNGASRPLAYPTMTVAEMVGLAVRDLAESDAHLYLWTVNRYVVEAYEITRAWGVPSLDASDVVQAAARNRAWRHVYPNDGVCVIRPPRQPAGEATRRSYGLGVAAPQTFRETGGIP